MFRYAYKVPYTEETNTYSYERASAYLGVSGNGAAVRDGIFFSKRGTINSIVLACFEQAINSSKYLGDGVSEMHDWESRNLSKCRNDQEFVMVRNLYKEKKNG